jgi:mannose-1-phosphate guanylyltransferase
MKLQPVILSGGSGYRLWPLSQQINPKQFIKYFDNFSSFQRTILRNKYLGEPLIIASNTHRKVVINQLKEIETTAQIIFEPESKNTAPCAIAASYYAKHHGFDAIALIPSDHHIENQESYEKAISKAICATKDYNFCTIGIAPTAANPNFGYIKTHQNMGNDLYLASKFIEKPNQALAQKLTNLSEYFWNSGIYLFDIEYILDRANELTPSISEPFQQLFNTDSHPRKILELDPLLYKGMPYISFDDAISSTINHMALVKANFKWIDLGNWEAISNFYQKDPNQNNIKGKVITHNVSNSYIDSDADQTLAIDLQDTIVVLKNGQLLISKKSGTGIIKDIITKLV